MEKFTSHAGANPSESKNRYCTKPLSFGYIGQNFMGNIQRWQELLQKQQK